MMLPLPVLILKDRILSECLRMQKEEELTVLLLRIYRDLEEIMWRWGTTLKECFLFSM